MNPASLEDSQDLIDWLMDRRMDFCEASMVLVHMELGDSLALAILRVFESKKINREDTDVKSTIDWGCPLTP